MIWVESAQGVLALSVYRRLRGSLEGKPEPGDRLRFVVFVSCVACVRAGKAKLRVCARCTMFLLTLALAAGSCVPVRGSSVKLRTWCA